MWIKDPSDVLEYVFDFAPSTNGRGDTNFLDLTSSPQETISSHTITVDSPGPTVEASSITESNTSVTVKLSGGTGGTKYTVTCQVVTSAGQTKEVSEVLLVANR